MDTQTAIEPDPVMPTAGRFLPGSTKARRMVAIAFIAQNTTSGLVLGSYGALVPSIEASFGATRTYSSLGIGLFALTVGLLCPLVGWLLRRLALRTMMTGGVMIGAMGYVGLAFTTDINAFVIIFGICIGLAGAMTGIIAPATLVSRWYRSARGTALGLVNLPICIILAPPITAAIVDRYGMNAWFYCAAALLTLLVPVMAMVKDAPEDVGELPHGMAATAVGCGEAPALPLARLLKDRRFWLMTLGVGISSGAGTAFFVHIIPFATASAISVQSGSLLITAYGVAGLIGNLALGRIADRLGAMITLGISLFCQAVIWMVILAGTGFPMLLASSALLGLFTASVVALHGAAVNEVFGHGNVSSVLGLAYFFKIPFNFGFAPLAGYLFVTAGNYVLPFGIFSTFLFAGAMGFTLLALWHAKAEANLVPQ